MSDSLPKKVPRKDLKPIDIKQVKCVKCGRRRDLYFVGSIIYCIDCALLYLV